MEHRFNGDLLRTARNARGWSQDRLAKKARVPQGKLSKLENSLTDLTDDQLARLAGALEFPPSLFLQPDNVFGLPISLHPMFRRRASVGNRELERLQAELNLHLLHIRRLLQSVTFEPELQLPALDVEDFETPQRIATLLRRTWCVPLGPFKNLLRWVERAGCFVVCGDFQSAIDGVTLKCPGMPPCIFLNRSQSVDRLRYTLAHELGHIVMHQVPSNTMEDEANIFAAELLMPEDQIRADLSGRHITLATLAALKPVWRVSMQALLVRAKELGLINESRARYLWQQMSARGFRTTEPVVLADQEEPTIHPELIRVHLEDLGYSVDELCSLLHVNQRDLQSMHPLPSSVHRHAFRLVR